jgi:hypothetical protein
MTINPSLILSTISIIFVIVNFAVARKDKSAKDSGDLSYNQGKIDQMLTFINDKLDKIDKRLDTYDAEIKTITREIVVEEIKSHILKYHVEFKDGNNR